MSNISGGSEPVRIVDSAGNVLSSAAGSLNVNITGGGGSGSNAAAGLTGAAVPTSADYGGINIGGLLQGRTGFSVGAQVAASVAIVDGAGNQITTFGGGTQYADGVTQATPTGTAALGKNPSNVLHALALDASGNLLVSLAANPFGTLTVSGTVSVGNFPATQPVSGTVTVQQGTAANLKVDLSGTGANAAAIKVDGSAVTQPVSGTVAATQSGTWTVQPGNTANTTAWKVDGSAVTQPVSGTVTVQQSTAANLKVDLSGTAANATAIKVDNSAVTQPVSGTVTVQQATAANLKVDLSGTAANATAIKVDGSAVTQPVSVAATLAVQGAKTNNNAAPGATNIGSLPSLANAALPAWTEGDQVTQSVDLSGGLRVVSRPPVVLGAYRLAVTTAVYTALGANAALISFRWTDATKICLITRVRVFVTTTTAATVAGRLDRALVVVRSFTVADSGGTAITLTGNNQKMRTSQATTVVGGVQVTSGNALTAGTGTADANPHGVIAKQGTATEPVGLTLGPEDLFIYNADQNYPLLLAANEGFRITIPTAMPTTIAMQTSAIIEWQEIATAGTF